MNNIFHIGYDWYKQHTEHVKRLLKEAKTSFIPCNRDISHPELWKAGSWKWFFENFPQVYDDPTIQHLDVGDRVVWRGCDAIVYDLDKTSDQPVASIYYWIKPVKFLDKIKFKLGLWGPGHAVSVGDEVRRVL